jgi:hypothetical protein
LWDRVRGQTCALQERVEVAVEEVGLVQRAADGVGKDQAVVVLFGSRVSALGGLAEPVVGKGIDGDARKQNLPPRRLGLELPDQVHGNERRVHVGPAKSEQLAFTHAGLSGRAGSVSWAV